MGISPKKLDTEAEKHSVFNDLKIINSSLPGLTAAVMASSMNDEVYSYLDELVPAQGRVEGRSKQTVTIVEEEEAVLDTELEYTRPNGEIYYARDWSGKKDVDVLRKARVAKLFPFLYGPPGTGKTALAEAAFGEDLLTIVISGDTEVTDLVGQFVPNPEYGVKAGEPEFIWVDGALLTAVREGRPVLIDEVGLADAKVLSVIYPLMDGRRKLYVSMNPSIGELDATEGFFIIGATNPNAPGVRMSEALLSRFLLHVEVTTDWALARKLGVQEKLVTAASNLAERVESNTLSWAPQFRELLAFRDISKEFGVPFAVKNLLASCPEMDRDEVQEVFRRAFGDEALAARI